MIITLALVINSNWQSKNMEKHNFKRTILHYCLEATHAYELESQIVDSNFISRNDVYNVKTGGSASYVYTDESKLKCQLHKKEYQN
jgi:hypothetical protein